MADTKYPADDTGDDMAGVDGLERIEKLVNRTGNSLGGKTPDRRPPRCAASHRQDEGRQGAMKMNHPEPVTAEEAATHIGESIADFNRRSPEQRLAIAETVANTKSKSTHVGAAEIAKRDAKLDDDDFAALDVSRRFAAADERAKVVSERAEKEAEAARVAVPAEATIAELRKQLEAADQAGDLVSVARIGVAVATLEAESDLDDGRGQVAP